MGHLNAGDIPFQRAFASSFTICDDEVRDGDDGFVGDYGDNPLWLFQACHDALASTDPKIHQLATGRACARHGRPIRDRAGTSTRPGPVPRRAPAGAPHRRRGLRPDRAERHLASPHADRPRRRWRSRRVPTTCRSTPTVSCATRPVTPRRGRGGGRHRHRQRSRPTLRLNATNTGKAALVRHRGDLDRPPHRPATVRRAPGERPGRRHGPIDRAARSWARTTGGSIVSVGSVTGFMAAPRQAAYGTARAGLTSLARTDGVRRVRRRGDPDERHHRGGDQHRCLRLGDPDGVDQIPVGRYGTVADVAAAAAVFLASPGSTYMVGQHLVVDGGVSVRGPSAHHIRPARNDAPCARPRGPRGSRGMRWPPRRP